ncbi:outer membrane protein assembly factor BamB family protein [Haladaptatus caseinilyticus]|uniref:outer membrane protein assembly factor BamB family protein n=1 Tax=Haladaptatus caseinilyticus TaxID=2993314 RepID=UPI00224AB6A9|nr:PQQ-binding-like beta-propeller repeat protein [Haladaptatus caseinilyticus]
MNSSPSSLSRRGFLTASGTAGIAGAVGSAQTTTTTGTAGNAPEPNWTISRSGVEAYYPVTAADGVVYVIGSSKSNGGDPRTTSVLAIEEATGNELWKKTFLSLQNLVAEAGTVFVVGAPSSSETREDRALIALSPKDGAERWRRPIERYMSRLAFDSETVYATERFNVVAYDIDSGTVRWKNDIESERGYSLDHRDDSVYVGTENGVYAFSAGSGRERWKRSGAEITESSQEGDATLRLHSVTEKAIICQIRGTIVSLNPDGSTHWTKSLDDGGYSAPEVHDGTLYLWNENLVALDVADGNVRWEYESTVRHGQRPIVADGAVFLNTGKRIIAVNTDGSERWTYELPATDNLHFYWGDIVEGVLYTIHYYRLYAFTTEDGTVKWSFEVDEEPTMLSVSEEHVILGTRGSVYGFIRQRPFPAMLVDETTDFLTSSAGFALSGVLLGTGVFAAYRRMNAETESTEVESGTEPELEYGHLERLGSDEFTETYRVRKRGEDGPHVVTRRYLTDPNRTEEFSAAVERWADLSDRRGVVPILDFDDGWVELPHYGGGSLADCERPLEEQIEDLSAANATVHRAHLDGMVHGGLTPESVLFDGDGKTDVSDWELAIALAEYRDTSAYDAPEQVAGSTVDERTDVYRLGAIARFLVTGNTPHVSAEEVPSADFDSSVSREVDAVLSKAMADDPNDRYESVVKFDDMLRWATFRA